MLRLVTALAVLALVLSSCSFAEEGDEARTYFESLDLSTPDAAAEEFVEAFDSSDYMTVWLTLDTHAQRAWISSFNLLQYRTILRVDESIRGEMSDLFSSFVWESSDYWYVFDQMMLLAEENEALLIDLEPEGLNAGTVNDDGTATVVGEFAGIDGEVTIHLTESPDGRWRVQQVMPPNGDPDSVPWGVTDNG